jgi:hypothetical protein
MERDLALGRSQPFRHLGVRRAGHVHVADELDVAAQRNRGEFPARTVAIVEAENFGPEADGKGLDADAAPAPDEIVAHLVDEHDDGQHEKERHDGADKQAV